MIDQDIVAQIIRLPTRDRLELIEVLTRSLRDDLVVQPPEGFTLEQKLSAMNRLTGIAATTDPAPTDEEIADDYATYVMRKYS